MNNKCPNSWIGRSGSPVWPPLSSNLRPSDFFTWGHSKSKIYSTSVDYIEKFERRVAAEVRGVGEETLKNVWGSIKLRLNFIKTVLVEGGHIENVMN